MSDSIIFLPADELQALFNGALFWEKVKSGAWTAQVKRSSHCNPPPDNHPLCTHSQSVRYYDEAGDRVAVIHQYLKPDGSIGGKGRPDPKFVIIDGQKYALDRLDH